MKCKKKSDESMTSVDEDDAATEFKLSEFNKSMISLKETSIKKSRLLSAKDMPRKRYRK